MGPSANGKRNSHELKEYEITAICGQKDNLCSLFWRNYLKKQDAEDGSKRIEQDAKGKVNVGIRFDIGISESEIEHIGNAVLESAINK